MNPREKINFWIDFTLLGILVIFTLLDTFLIWMIKSRKPELDNAYFNLHKKYGFGETTVLKIGAAVIIFIMMATHQPRSGLLAAPITVHAGYVIKLFIDFLKSKKKENASRVSV